MLCPDGICAQVVDGATMDSLYQGFSTATWVDRIYVLYLCVSFAVSHIESSLLLLLSRFSHVQLCATPEMAAHQAPPSPGFSRQEHRSGLPSPSPRHESEK